ncbi:MAG: hypothetical protein MUC49_03815 [Raineya sp.]|jgi:hypothetical protein|nr:hypothetical protein [Raineya sp.]
MKTQYLEELKFLRKRIPIAISQAILLLNDYQGDTEIVQKIFKEQCIQEIIKATHCSWKIAEEAYLYTRYDVDKAITLVIEDEFDRNYVSHPEITKEKLKVVRNWLDWNSNNHYWQLYLSLAETTDIVISILTHLKDFEDLKNLLISNPMLPEKIFNLYKDRLDKTLSRHWRNLNRDFE